MTPLKRAESGAWMSGSEFAGKMIISGFGTGYLRPAPGTWGSAAVAAICFALLYVTGGNVTATNFSLAVIVIAATVACVVLGQFAERAYGRKDPSECTIDEWAGQALALLALPLGATAASWAIAVGVGLAAFRFFDILKPPPVRQLERLKAGWGVVADDLMAGIYANVAAQLVLRLVVNQ